MKNFPKNDENAKKLHENGRLLWEKVVKKIFDLQNPKKGGGVIYFREWYYFRKTTILQLRM